MDAGAKKQLQSGKRLTAEKKFCKAIGQTWTSYVEQNCGISRRRADELIRISAGKLTVEESRTLKLKSQRKTRALRQDKGVEVVERHLQQAKLIEQRVRQRLKLEGASKSTVQAIKRPPNKILCCGKGFCAICKAAQTKLSAATAGIAPVHPPPP